MNNLFTQQMMSRGATGAHGGGGHNPLVPTALGNLFGINLGDSQGILPMKTDGLFGATIHGGASMFLNQRGDGAFARAIKQAAQELSDINRNNFNVQPATHISAPDASPGMGGDGMFIQ